MSRRFAATAVVALGLMLGIGACGDDDDADSDSTEGAAVAAMVMAAFETGDQADIDAIYAPDVQMVIDQQTVADNRTELATVISTALGTVGNTYEQIGPVTEYLGADGDLYVATLVEVVGPAHPEGDPLVGFYRVRDGQVIRHVFMEAQLY